MRDVILAVNPKSGSGQRQALVKQMVAAVESAGFQCSVQTDVAQLKLQVAETLNTRSLQAVISAGGDGTIGLLVNQLPAETPFVLFPMGTENLLAKYLKIHGTIEQLVAMTQARRIVQMDAGRANGQLFLVMASCGFDADVVRRMGQQRRGNIGHWSYFGPIWESIFSYSYPPLKITVDGQLVAEQPTWAFVFNAPRYAMNLQIVPQADAFDGQLDLRTFRRGKLISGLGYLFSILTGQRRKSSQFYRAQRITIESANSMTVPYQLDGDPGGELPVQIETVPRRVNLLVPAEFELGSRQGD